MKINHFQEEGQILVERTRLRLQRSQAHQPQDLIGRSDDLIFVAATQAIVESEYLAVKFSVEQVPVRQERHDIGVAGIPVDVVEFHHDAVAA